MTSVHGTCKKRTKNSKGVRRRLVDFGFRLLYRELAWTYDLVAGLVSFGQWQTWVRTALPHLTGERVLELGHGPGHLLVSLTERGFTPVGLDASPQMTRKAHRRLQNAGFTPRLIRGRAQQLPFATQTFDSVVATFPTAFIFRTSTLNEVARIMRPEGRLVTVLGASMSSRDPLTRFIEWLYSVTGQREMIDAAELEALFREAGLSVHRLIVELKRSRVWLLVAEPATRDDKGSRNTD